ncbi:MAG: cation:proton antiporter [Ardenticatenaceae bacterium]|nr:cation:proton antiporter [Ardenticatenaceae bacterium]MCB9446123.1 cation:proton antiporter [Ardenticatenaceae bacterium]
MASEFLNFILALVVIIVAAKASGYLSSRLHQPSVLGELLAGLILGPTVLDMFHVWPVFSHDAHLAESITLLAEMGVLLLMMLAGLELHLPELIKSGKVSALAGTLGVLIPLGLGWGTAVLFDASTSGAIFIGLALAATSVSISAQTLLELRVLRSRVGLALLGAAVFDDILVILALSISLLLVGGGDGGTATIVITILKMLGYLVGASVIGFWLIPRLIRWVDKLPISQGTVAAVLVICLLYAWSAEALGGMASITGAFLVGLFLAQVSFKERIETAVATLAYGFFVPIFFVNIGLEVNLRAISGSAWWFALLLTVVAVISKIIGSGLGARLSGFTNRESLQLGVGMVSRGEVGLIVASFALIEGLISSENFSIVVFMVIMATLLTPPMLRAVFAADKPAQSTT